MSLINQALKLEQQRRNANASVQPPMIARSARGGTEKWPLIFFGVTGMGALLAVSITAVFYFGSGFLDKRGSETSRSLAVSIPQDASVTATPNLKAPAPTSPAVSNNQVGGLLDELSAEQISAVQAMLLEQNSQQAAQASTPSAAPVNSVQAFAVAPTGDLGEISRIQAVVDGFSVQGIRKAGQDSRVFLNGKIHGIGDVVDIENGLVLLGFTETDLVFKNRAGHVFKKSI